MIYQLNQHQTNYRPTKRPLHSPQQNKRLSHIFSTNIKNQQQNQRTKSTQTTPRTVNTNNHLEIATKNLNKIDSTEKAP